MKTIFVLAAIVAAAFAIPGTTVNENDAQIIPDPGNPNITDAALDERSYQRISFRACYRRSWAVRCCGYGSGRHRYHCQDGKLISCPSPCLAKLTYMSRSRKSP